MLAYTGKGRFFVALTLAALLFGCGGGGGGGGGVSGGGDLVLLETNVDGASGIPLNQVVEFEFSAPLDRKTVRADTMRIRRGPDYGFQVPGSFEVDGNRVRFYPRLPVKADLSDSGFAPGVSYRIQVPGYPEPSTVRSTSGETLLMSAQQNFTTADAAAVLFVDNFLDPGPPRVERVSPQDGVTGVPADAEITLEFSRRPLHPATVTAANITLTLVERDGVVHQRPVEGAPKLAQSHGLVSVVWEPRYPLADRATYRLDVSRRTQDISGSDVTPFSSTFTTRDEPARPGEMVLDFSSDEWATVADQEVTTASWSDAKPDELGALFTVAGGDGTSGDFRPEISKVYTPDDFNRGVRVKTVDGVETDVVNFRSIEIPTGVQVRFAPRPGENSRPVMLLSLKDIKIDGTLTVSGGGGLNGETASTTSNIPVAAGGSGGPGGAAGAGRYTGKTAQDAPRQNGGSVQFGGGGGQGGGTSNDSRISYAGGGGGGGSREAGKDGTRGNYTFSTAQNGARGNGGESTVERGYDVNVERRPNVGGAGGGAGGLGFYYPTGTNWRNGGGTGGGGGGAVTIQSAGDVLIGQGGQVDASGGDGGSTSSSSYYYGGGGGGGGGGSILIRAAGKVRFNPLAALDASGGTGGAFAGTYSRYAGGLGGAGGGGYIRLEACEAEQLPGEPDIEGLSGALVLGSAPSKGLYDPQGAGAPSVGQTLWLNLGVFDPELKKPSAGDVGAELFNDSMKIEVQMATEDPHELGAPYLAGLDGTDSDKDGEYDDTLDPATLSEWTSLSQIESLNGNGYQFIRVRVTFQLDANQRKSDPLPSIDRLRIPYFF